MFHIIHNRENDCNRETGASPAFRLRKSGHVSATVHICSLRYLALGPFHRGLLQHRIWTTWRGEIAKHQQRYLVPVCYEVQTLMIKIYRACMVSSVGTVDDVCLRSKSDLIRTWDF